MIDFQYIMAAGVAAGMAAGYWRGRVEGRQRERLTIKNMTMITVRSTTALARGAIDVLRDKLKIDELDATKMLLTAAGEHGFMGVVLDAKTGEVIHGHNPTQQK